MSEKDKGQADAVNKGLKMTTGGIIGWLNSDDIYYPGAIRTVCQFLKSHPEVDVVYGDAHHIDDKDRVLEVYYTEPWDLERLKEICYLCQPAVFFRRRVVDRFGMLDERLYYCLDYEYWLRLAMGGANFCYLKNLLAGSRLYAENKTLGARLNVHKEINDMMRERLRRVPDRWVFNYAHVYLETKGLPRKKRLSFAVAVSAVSLLASVRWNKRVSWKILLIITRWVGSTARSILRELFTR